jgi:hypothetical protein
MNTLILLHHQYIHTSLDGLELCEINLYSPQTPFDIESYIQTNALLYTIKYLSKILILRHSKTRQHVSTIIQIIFRELVCSLLKSLNLKI